MCCVHVDNLELGEVACREVQIELATAVRHATYCWMLPWLQSYNRRLELQVVMHDIIPPAGAIRDVAGSLRTLRWLALTASVKCER